MEMLGFLLYQYGSAAVLLFPYGSAVVLLFPYRSAGVLAVPIWNEVLGFLLLPYGSAGVLAVPIWKSWGSCCSHMEVLGFLLFPYGSAEVHKRAWELFFYSNSELNMLLWQPKYFFLKWQKIITKIKQHLIRNCSFFLLSNYLNT